jgi:A/G-specific adenine glycosylase
LQEAIPPPAPTPEKVEVQEAAVVLWLGERVLLVQRPEEGRWAGMWEFVHGPLQPDEGHDDAARRLVGELGFRAELGPELLTVRHGVTRFHITLVCIEARHRAGRFAAGFYPAAHWVRPEELANYPISSPQRRLIQVINQSDRQRLLF